MVDNLEKNKQVGKSDFDTYPTYTRNRHTTSSNQNGSGKPTVILKKGVKLSFTYEYNKKTYLNQ